MRLLAPGHSIITALALMYTVKRRPLGYRGSTMSDRMETQYVGFCLDPFGIGRRVYR